VLAKAVADLLILMTTVIVVDRVAYVIELAVFGAMTRELLYTAVAAIILALAAHLLMAHE
jgi:hypothetical protein